jgi:hypothetical protein
MPGNPVVDVFENNVALISICSYIISVIISLGVNVFCPQFFKKEIEFDGGIMDTFRGYWVIIVLQLYHCVAFYKLVMTPPLTVDVIVYFMTHVFIMCAVCYGVYSIDDIVHRRITNQVKILFQSMCFAFVEIGIVSLTWMFVACVIASILMIAAALYAIFVNNIHNVIATMIIPGIMILTLLTFNGIRYYLGLCSTPYPNMTKKKQ